MSPADIVQKLWNYCNVLRDDGMSYGDYVEQLTYLLFLKMADERINLPASLPVRGRTQTGGAGKKPDAKKKSIVPEKYSWASLLKRDGEKNNGVEKQRGRVLNLDRI